MLSIQHKRNFAFSRYGTNMYSNTKVMIESLIAVNYQKGLVFIAT